MGDLKSELYSSVSALQTMIEPILEFKSVNYSTKTNRLPPENSYYIVDPVLELVATGRYSVLKKLKQDQEDLTWYNTERIVQEQRLTDLTRYWCSPCQRLFSDRNLWVKHRSDTQCSCCDVFFDLKYDHSFGTSLRYLRDAK